jgi:hypothetical protein
MLSAKSAKRFLLMAMCVAPFLLYMLAGFVLMPKGLEHYLTRNVAEKTAHTITVGAIRFNPFTWQLQVNDFAMQDSQLKPLLRFATLDVDVDGVSLLQTALLDDALRIEAISLQQPFVDIAINAQGELNLQQVFAKFGESDSSAVKEKTEVKNTNAAMPAVSINKLVIDNGVIDFATAQFKKPYRQSWQLQQLVLEDFDTHNDGAGNRLSVNLNGDKKSTLVLTTQMNVKQQQVSGDLTIKQFDIKPLVDDIDIPFTGYMAALPLDFYTGFKVSFKDALTVQLQKSDLRLHHIQLSQTASSPVLVNIPLLQVKGLDVDLPAQKISMEKVTAADGQLQLAIDKAGNTNWQALLPASTDNSPTAKAKNAQTKPAAASKPWQVLVKKLQFSNYGLQLHSEQTATPMDLDITAINLGIENWLPLQPDKPFPLTLAMNFSDDGHLDMQADVQTTPLNVTGKATLQKLSLKLFQPFLDDIAILDFKKGQLDSAIDFNVQHQEALVVKANGSATVHQFKMRKKASKKKLLNWEKLTISQFSFNLPDNHLDIKAIDIEQLYARFIIDEKGVSNLQNLLLTAPSQSTVGVTDESGKAPLSWDVDVINILNGDMGFSDLSMQPGFRTAIKSLAGDIRNISSRPDEKATVNLRGKVDRYAPVSIAGTFNLNMEKPQLDMVMDFKNIELTSFTPYSGIYAGYAIDKGQVSMDLEYRLVNNRIKGKNHIVLNQLTFGKKVESDKAIDLPLKLAIALLSDENGIIDMGFNVKGNINDPQFALTKVIYKALLETLKKAVTAPFKFLRGAFKGKQKNVQRLTFAPGSEEADSHIDEKLAAVAQIMQGKKQLQLNIQGNVQPDVDKPALQEKELLQILSVETRQNPELFLPASTAGHPANNKDLYDIVADYYEKQRDETLSDVEKRIATQWKKEANPIDNQQLKQQAYAQAWQKLVETTAVTADDIADLGIRRAQQAKAILVERHNIPAQRIFVLDGNAASAESSLITRLYVDVQ